MSQYLGIARLFLSCLVWTFRVSYYYSTRLPNQEALRTQLNRMRLKCMRPATIIIPNQNIQLSLFNSHPMKLNPWMDFSKKTIVRPTHFRTQSQFDSVPNISRHKRREMLCTLSIARHSICGHHEFRCLFLLIHVAESERERRHFRQSRLFKYYSDRSRSALFGYMALVRSLCCDCNMVLRGISSQPWPALPKKYTPRETNGPHKTKCVRTRVNHTK